MACPGGQRRSAGGPPRARSTCGSGHAYQIPVIRAGTGVWGDNPVPAHPGGAPRYGTQPARTEPARPGSLTGRLPPRQERAHTAPELKQEYSAEPGLALTGLCPPASPYPPCDIRRQEDAQLLAPGAHKRSHTNVRDPPRSTDTVLMTRLIGGHTCGVVYEAAN